MDIEIGLWNVRWTLFWTFLGSFPAFLLDNDLCVLQILPYNDYPRQHTFVSTKDGFERNTTDSDASQPPDALLIPPSCHPLD